MKQVILVTFLLLCSLVYCQIQCPLPYTQCGNNLCYNPQIQNCVNGNVVSIGQPGTVPPPGNECALTANDASTILSVWIDTFPYSTILPVVGFPENANGAVTIMHDLRLASNAALRIATINSLDTYSPLVLNAFYSAECRDGQYINLYKVTLPDIPGLGADQVSTVQHYINALYENGLDVSGAHYHWSGLSESIQDKGLINVHHQKTSDMTPTEFANRTITALTSVLTEIALRTA